jgi:hypothetical protein
MAELVIGILSTAGLCSIGFILLKLCTLRDETQDISPDYLLVRKEHYDALIKNSAQVKNYTNEQPKLPSYSESSEAPPSLVEI